MKCAQSVLPLLLLVQAAPAKADALTDLFPPETRAVFGLRLHSLASSSVVQTLAAQLHSQSQALGMNWTKMLAFDGFDPLRDIDEVMLASSAEGKNPPALIVAAGRFDVSRVAEGARRYHDVPLLGGDKDQDSVIALLDGSTAVAGDQKLVRAAIDRRQGGAHIDAALNDRITSLRQRYDIWGLGDRPDGFAAPSPEVKSLESIDRFQFGVQLSSGLEFSGEIHARNAADAEKLNTTLQMIAAMLKAQQSPSSGGTFDLDVKDGTIKLAFSIPEAELKKIVANEAAALMPQTVPAADAQPAPPAPESLPVVSGADVVTASAPATPPAPPAEPGEDAVKDTLKDTAPKDAAPKDTAPKDAAPKETGKEAPASTAKAVAKAAATQVTDREGNTVILQLPGKK